MDRKQIDKMFDGIKLDDELLDHVVGGVNVPAKSAVAAAPQLNMVKPAAPPKFHK